MLMLWYLCRMVSMVYANSYILAQSKKKTVYFVGCLLYSNNLKYFHINSYFALVVFLFGSVTVYCDNVIISTVNCVNISNGIFLKLYSLAA